MSTPRLRSFKTSGETKKEELSDSRIWIDSPEAPALSAVILGLTLGELEFSSRTTLTVLLSLHHTGVPGQEAVASQGLPVVFIVPNESSGNTMPARSGLSRGTTALDVDYHIVFAQRIGYIQWLLHHIGETWILEVRIHIFAVYGYFSISLTEIYPRDRGLASACSQ
jgi:hypothetical protein